MEVGRNLSFACFKQVKVVRTGLLQFLWCCKFSWGCRRISG